MGARLKDVAEELGMDLSTISRALRNDPRVKIETQLRVAECAKRMGYVANPTARALAKGKTGVIWLILPYLESPVERLPAQYVSKILFKKDYDLMLVQYHNSLPIYERLLDRLSGGVADGAIVISPSSNIGMNEKSQTEPTEARLVKNGIPFVFLDRGNSALNVPLVTTANESAVYDAIQRYSEGVDTIVSLFLSRNEVEVHRERGAVRGAKRLKIPIFLEGKIDHAELTQKSILIIASSYGHALKYVKENQIENFIKVVIVFDADSNYFPGNPLLISIVQNFEEMGERAVDLLLSHIESGGGEWGAESMPSLIAPLRIVEC